MENKQPKEIYLQIGVGTDLNEHEFKELEGVTWCIDNIYENDLKYISEAHHNEIVEGLKAEIESLKSKAESKRKHWNTK